MGIDEMVGEWESTLRKGVGDLSDWARDATELARKRPAVVLAALGAVGFVTGVLLRRDSQLTREIGLNEIQAPPVIGDPLFVLGAGVVLGLTLGPRVVEQAMKFASEAQQALEPMQPSASASLS